MSEKTYRIGEAAAKLNLKTYVLRFWEMEFSQIAPVRTEKGQRLYREIDLAVLGRIRYLLHERGLTIEGARRLLQEEAARGVTYTDTEMALPENFVDEGENGEDETCRVSVASLNSVQGSLLPVAPVSSTPAEPDHFPQETLHDVIQELSAIRALLGKEGTGDRV